MKLTTFAISAAVLFACMAVPAADTDQNVTPTDTPKAADKVLDWQDGDRVKHAIFGEGVIESVEGKGPSQIIRVRFKNGVEKRLTALYAPLTRLT